MSRSIVLGVVFLVLAACTPIAGGADSPELSEQYGCGYGFYIGDAEQTTGLFVRYLGAGPFQAGDVTGTYRLPEDDWTAELSTGRDLFANWCDDVIEPDEPEAVVDQTWPVEGELEVLAVPPAGECGEARATLRDAVAVGSDGSTLRLGDLELINETWGCFAG